MSEFEELVEGYVGPLADSAADPGPLSAQEAEILAASVVSGAEIAVSDDEPPHEPDDWPEEGSWPESPPEIPLIPVDTVPPAELRVLKPDQIPLIGSHYVVFNGIPRPVIRGNYQISEDEHVRTQLGGMDDLKDADGQRRERAARTIRMRYRGYLCGEVGGL